MLATIKIVKEKSKIRYNAGNPSLKNAMAKEKYTIAAPGSFCKTDNMAGVNAMAAAIN
jgi:hypothetical protein